MTFSLLVSFFSLFFKGKQQSILIYSHATKTMKVPFLCLFFGTLQKGLIQLKDMPMVLKHTSKCDNMTLSNQMNNTLLIGLASSTLICWQSGVWIRKHEKAQVRLTQIIILINSIFSSNSYPLVSYFTLILFCY